MRRSSLAFLALAWALPAGSAEAQTLRIGYLNSQQILASSPEATAAQQQFDQEMQTFQAEVQQLETEITGMQQRLEQQLQAKVTEYQTRTTQLQQLADQRRNQLIQPVMDRITVVIEALREEGQYSLILDVAAGSIISADSTLDLTPEVIRRLGTAPAAATAPR